jgi:UDP-glucose 4-epimerase
MRRSHLNPVVDKNHLVIGQGLLGREILAHLRESGGEATAPHSIPWSNPHLARLRVIDEVKNFIVQTGSKPWAIYWCAGVVNMRSSQASVNLESEHILSLLEAIESNERLSFQDCQLMFASSIGGVFSGSAVRPFTESSFPVPMTPYGQLKIEQENQLKSASRKLGIRLLISRISSLYGVKQNILKNQGLLSHVARAAVARETLEIFTSLTTMRNFIKSNEAAKLIVEHMYSQRELIRVANICSMENVSIAAVIQAAERILQRRIPVRFVESEIIRTDSENLNAETYFTEMSARNVRTPMHVGLRELIESAISSVVSPNTRQV